MTNAISHSRFDTFRISPENQAALEMCRAVAGLHYAGPKPVLLCGPAAAGKSHLLWSIIKHVRMEGIKTGLALIVPGDFPEALRHLLIDPSPIQSALPAILLVDGLEGFQEDTGPLEAVVRLFLDHGHPVVLASRVPPEELLHFSASFRELLKNGNVARIGEEEAASEDDVNTIPEETRGRESLAERLAETQALLEEARAEQARLRHALEDTRERDGLRARHADAIRAFESELEALRQELAEVRMERDEFAEQAAENSGYRKQLDELRRETAVLRNENELANKEIQRLQSDLDLTQQEYDRLRGLMITMESLEEELCEAREERDAARDAYLRLVEEVNSILDAIYPEEEDSAVADNLLQITLDPLREYIRNAMYSGSPGALARHERLRLASALETAQRQLALQNAEMDALRHEAAQQVASAQVASGELERRIAHLELALEAALETGRATAAEAKRIGDDLYHAFEAVNLLLSGLGRLDVLHPPPKPLPEESETEQGVLFDPEPYRRPPIFDSERFKEMLEAVCSDTLSLGDGVAGVTDVGEDPSLEER